MGKHAPPSVMKSANFFRGQRKRNRTATRDGLSFEKRCKLERLPIPLAEYPFARHEGRRWRFDYAWPEYRVALEVEGGMFAGGQHVRPAGIRRDLEKYNAAAVNGWIVLRCLPETLAADSTIQIIQRAMDYRAAVQMVFSHGRLT